MKKFFFSIISNISKIAYVHNAKCLNFKKHKIVKLISISSSFSTVNTVLTNSLNISQGKNFFLKVLIIKINFTILPSILSIIY